MLNAHPEIYFSKESHFVKKYISKEVKGNLREIRNKEQISKKFSSDVQMIDYMDVMEEVLNEVYDQPEKDIKSSEIFLKLLERKSGINVRYVGEKDPMNVNFLKEINTAYPNAKILHIIRDPRAVISSRLKSEWGKGRSLYFHCLEYYYSIQKSIKEGIEYFGKNYFDFRYEDLVDNPEQKLTEICNFLDLEFDLNMLEYQKSSENLVRKDEMKWKSNIFRPILSENKEKWRKELRKRQISLIELYLGPILKMLNYKLETQVKSMSYIIYNYFFIFSVKIIKMING